MISPENILILSLRVPKFSQYKLCFIDAYTNLAYFTTLPLSEIGGEKWSSAAYEHNAGIPYIINNDNISKIISVVFCLNSLIMPCSKYDNSPYSVRQINNKEVPWLGVFDYHNYTTTPLVWAGDSLFTFLSEVSKHTEIYLSSDFI